ncbi:helix-turn-helix domain-containing protein [Bacillaceae bacterium W0354]
MPMIGKTIKWYRNELGWTQEQLASGICSSTYVSQLENDLIPTNKEVLLKICRKLGINEKKVLDEIDLDCLQKVKNWLKYINEFDVSSADTCYEEIKEQIDENTHYDIEYLYKLGLLGYYLIKDYLINLDDIFLNVYDFKDLYKESDPYNFHKFVGIYFKRKGLFLDALDHLKQAEQIMSEEEDPELYLSLAITYSYLNKILISNRYAQKAFKRFHEKLFYNRIIECQIILNQNYCIVGDYDSIEQQLERLVEIENDHVTEKTKANIYNHIGFVYFTKREFEKSIDSLLKVRELNINQADFLKSRHALAFIYFNLKKYEMAEVEIEKGMKLSDKYNLDRYKIKFEVLRLRIKDDKEQLVTYLKEIAIPFFEKSGEIFELKSYYRLMGNTLFDLKRYKSAAKYYKLLDVESLV